MPRPKGSKNKPKAPADKEEVVLDPIKRMRDFLDTVPSPSDLELLGVRDKIEPTEENLSLLRQLALNESENFYRFQAALVYGQLRGGCPMDEDPVFNHKSATLKEVVLVGANTVDDVELICYLATDPDPDVAASAEDYLRQQPSTSDTF